MTPILLSRSATLALFAVGVALIVFPSGARNRQLASLLNAPSFSRSEVAEFVNSSRTAAGLPMLAENSTLAAAAEAKVKDMIAKQYFSHASPDGRTPWDFFRAQNYTYTAAGENLAIDFISAREAHEALMASPAHRANILSGLYTEMGVAIAKGVFEGRETVFIAEYFGKPKPVAVSNPFPATPVPPKKANAVPPPPVPASPVLGEGVEVARPAPSEISLRFEKFSALSGAEVFRSLPTRAFAFGVVFLVLLAVVFLVTRGGSVSRELAFRAFALLLLFGYIGIHGGAEPRFPRVPQDIASEIVASLTR